MDVRTLLLLLLTGGLTVYAAFRNPALGAAIAVGAAVVTLLYTVLKDSD